MGFWNRKLNKIQDLLADLYDDKASTRGLVNRGGLEASEIEFSDKAKDNWHNILLAASKAGQLDDFLRFMVKESENPTLAAAYEEYRTNSAPFGGGASVESDFFKNIWRWLKQRWRLAAVLGGLVLAAAVGLAVFYYLVPVTVSGYVYCGPEARFGEPAEAATVRVPGTAYNAKTGKDGSFIFKVPRRALTKTLEVLYAGEPPQIVPLEKYTNNDFKVARCQQSATPPSPEPIPFRWWKETPLEQAAIACEPSSEYSQVKLYTLEPEGSIRKTGHGNLFVNVSTFNRWKIIDAVPTRPGRELGLWYETADRPDYRQWEFEMAGDHMEIRIQVCFGSTDAPPFSEAFLDTNYYFK